jgi:uncharacterized protein (TIGR02996 family)
MTDRAAFVAAIEADPDSDLPRLAWADWLDDHGEPERAELIRVQCELARHPSPKLRGRERAVLNALGRVWPAGLAGLRAFNLPFRQGLRNYFRRGCLHGFQFYTSRPHTRLTAAAPYVGREPLLDVCLFAGRDVGRRQLANPLLRLVAFLHGSGASRLLPSRHMTGLRHLHCRADDLQTLLTAPAATRLVSLLVEWTSPWAEESEKVPPVKTARLLADNPRLAALQELMVLVEPFGEEALRVLIGSPHLPTTLKLELPTNSRPRRGTALARALRARFPGPPAVG